MIPVTFRREKVAVGVPSTGPGYRMHFQVRALSCGARSRSVRSLPIGRTCLYFSGTGPAPGSIHRTADATSTRKD